MSLALQVAKDRAEVGEYLNDLAKIEELKRAKAKLVKQHEELVEKIDRDVRFILAEEVKVCDRKIEAADRKIEAADRRINASDLKVQESNRDILVISLAKMIHSPGASNELGVAAKCKEIVTPYINQRLQINSTDLLVFCRDDRCLRFTLGVASLVQEMFQTISCISPDLTKFKHQIDPTALRSMLADRRITRVILDATNKGTLVEQVALEIKNSRSLEVVFQVAPAAAPQGRPQASAAPQATPPATATAVKVVPNTTIPAAGVKPAVEPVKIPTKALPPPPQKQKTHV